MSRYVRPIPFLVLATIAIIAMAAGSQLLRSAPNLYAHHDNADTAIADQAYVPDIFASDAAGSPQSLQLATSSRQLEQAVVGRSTTFTITLKPGWTAVYLPIQPEASDLAHVLEGIPVRSVWSWSQQSQVPSPPNATDLEPGQADWLAYFPPTSESSSHTNLFVLNGGRGYLIELNGDQAVDWVVSGQPVLPSSEWLADSYNLVGFHVDPNAPPTFKSFFTSAKAHSNQKVFRLAPAGQWQEITNLSAEQVRPGQAYWVYSKGPSDYSGPLQITLEQGKVLDFGKVLSEQTLRIRNRSSESKQIAIGQQETTPYLAYWGRDGGSEGWLSFPHVFQVMPNEELTLRVAVRRNKISDRSINLHRSVLEISDKKGVRLLIPVAVESLGANRPGLWVGTAILNQVNQPTDTSGRDVPKPTGSEFQIRLIVHVDEDGQARLLQQVTLMWKEGTERTDPQDPSKKIVETPGRFVLVTRDDLLHEFAGAAIRDGKQVGRRISSAAFSFREPVTLTGHFGSGQLKSDPITIDYNDPLNPFKHKYHPNHDNLDYRFEAPLSEGKESYTIVRTIELEFKSDDSGNLNQLGVGADQVGGVYRETIQGVHKDVLYVKGTFQLQLASTIDKLNDGR